MQHENDSEEEIEYKQEMDQDSSNELDRSEKDRYLRYDYGQEKETSDLADQNDPWSSGVNPISIRRKEQDEEKEGEYQAYKDAEYDRSEHSESPPKKVKLIDQPKDPQIEIDMDMLDCSEVPQQGENEHNLSDFHSVNERENYKSEEKKLRQPSQFEQAENNRGILDDLDGPFDEQSHHMLQVPQNRRAVDSSLLDLEVESSNFGKLNQLPSSGRRGEKPGVDSEMDYLNEDSLVKAKGRTEEGVSSFISNPRMAQEDLSLKEEETLDPEKLPVVEVDYDSSQKPLQFIIKISGESGSTTQKRTFENFQQLHAILERDFFFLVLPILPAVDWKPRFWENSTDLQNQANGLRLYVLRLLSSPQLAACPEVKIFLEKKTEWLGVKNIKEGWLKSMVKTVGSEIAQLRQRWNGKRYFHFKFGAQEKEVDRQTVFLEDMIRNFAGFTKAMMEGQAAFDQAALIRSKLVPGEDSKPEESPWKFQSGKNSSGFLELLSESKYDLDCCRTALERVRLLFFQLDQLQEEVNAFTESKRLVDPVANSKISYLHLLMRQKTMVETELTKHLAVKLLRNSKRLLSGLEASFAPAILEALSV